MLFTRRDALAALFLLGKGAAVTQPAGTGLPTSLNGTISLGILNEFQLY